MRVDSLNRYQRSNRRPPDTTGSPTLSYSLAVVHQFAPAASRPSRRADPVDPAALLRLAPRPWRRIRIAAIATRRLAWRLVRESIEIDATALSDFRILSQICSSWTRSAVQSSKAAPDSTADLSSIATARLKVRDPENPVRHPPQTPPPEVLAARIHIEKISVSQHSEQSAVRDRESPRPAPPDPAAWGPTPRANIVLGARADRLHVPAGSSNAQPPNIRLVPSDARKPSDERLRSDPH